MGKLEKSGKKIFKPITEFIINFKPNFLHRSDTDIVRIALSFVVVVSVKLKTGNW